MDLTQNTRLNAVETINNNQNTSIGIIQGVDDTQNTRITIIEGVDVTQNTSIQLAFNKANNALPNTGSLITVNSDSQLYISNTQPSISNSTGALIINGGLGITGNVNIQGLLNVNGVGITGSGALSSNTLTVQTINVTSTNTSTNIITGALVVAGGVGIGGDVYVGGRMYTNNIPLVLSDISNQFDGSQCVFQLKSDQQNVTSIMDSKNLEVVVGGLRLAPYVKDLRYPWITPYDSHRGFRVSTQNTSSLETQTLTIYNAPDVGSQAFLTIINSSSSSQTKKYPYSADTIALGD